MLIKILGNLVRTDFIIDIHEEENEVVITYLSGEKKKIHYNLQDAYGDLGISGNVLREQKERAQEYTALVRKEVIDFIIKQVNGGEDSQIKEVVSDPTKFKTTYEDRMKAKYQERTKKR